MATVFYWKQIFRFSKRLSQVVQLSNPSPIQKLFKEIFPKPLISSSELSRVVLSEPACDSASSRTAVLS